MRRATCVTKRSGFATVASRTDGSPPAQNGSLPSLDLPHQQRMRDVIGLEIGDGTAQIMKLLVAREIIGKSARPY